MKTCEWCGREFGKRPKLAYWQWELQRFCSRSCKTSARNYKPAEQLSAATKYRQGALSHRKVMEAVLGRELLPTEHVHHLNDNKLDNRPENLAIKTARDHGLHHFPPVHPVEKTCVVCGIRFVPHKTKRKRKQTCGDRACVSTLIWRKRRERSAA